MSVETEGAQSNETNQAGSSTSALRDNIEKKGKNAYYFAHAHKATGPKWDGKAEPRLLSKHSSNEISSSLRQSTATFQYHKSNVTKYAFLDENKKVKLYIELEGVGDKCTDDDISLDFNEKSLCLVVRGYDEEEDKCLSFGRLHAEITSVSFKRKTNKIILILVKKDEKDWPQISANTDADNEVV